MDESGLRNWLTQQGVNPKLISDIVSRLKKLCRDFSIDLDKEYQTDGGTRVLNLFNKKGDGLGAISQNSTVPIGRYSLATYKLAVKKYLVYLSEQEHSRTR